MQQLSELDSSFLFLETDRTPLHVGGVLIFLKSNKQTKFSFNRFRELVRSKLGNESFSRQRLIESPLNIDLPVWSDDPNFDLDNHLQYINIKQHKSKKTLLSVAAEINSMPLNRNHPLWHIAYIDGLEGENNLSKRHFALVIRNHITTINGTTGEDVIAHLLRASSEIFELGEPQEWEPEPLPDTGKILGIAYENALTIPSKLAHLAKETASSAFYSVLYERLQSLDLPAALMSVSATPINRKISSNRIIDNFEVSLADIRAIRKSLETVTTNDVIMGICAEALVNCLKDNNSEPKSPLIALAPISVRSTSLDVKSGNQLAATLFSLANLEVDPIKRIQLIHEAAISSKNYDTAIAANVLTELVPSCVAALSARVYSEFLLAQKHKPVFNLPITNIPGPQSPLYLEDNELTNYLCTSPLFDGIGLAITIVSYNGEYSITATYCPDMFIKTEPFSTYLGEALEKIKTSKAAAQHKLNEDTGKRVASTGFIEDVVGLVSNLFAFGGSHQKNDSEK